MVQKRYDFIEKLTDEDVKVHTIRDTLSRYLEFAGKKLSINKQQMKVLDFGCGRGRTVLILRENGYEAYGVDINQARMELGYELIEERLKCDVKNLLRPIREDGTISFPDDFFHFVFSEQVFEHVKDLDKVASEINRVSKIGSSFPGLKQ